MASVSASPIEGTLQQKPASVPIFGLLVTGLVVLFIATNVRSYLRLSKFKGPRLAAWSKAWQLQCTWNKNTHWKLKEVCEKYGSLARVGPNELVTSDPDLIMKMSNVRSPYTKSETYSGTQFDKDVNHIFSERNEERHTALRKKLTSGYSGKENPYLEKSLDAQVLELTNLIDAKYLSAPNEIKPVDFGRLAHFFTLDAISEVAFGQALGFLTEDEDINGYCHAAEEVLPMFEWATVLPALNQFARLPGINRLTMPTADDKQGIGMLMGFARKLVGDRFRNAEKDTKGDMLGSFIKHGLTQREAETEAVLQMMAGSDTTVTALRSTALFIMTNPRIYTRLQQELDDAHRKDMVSSPVITNAEAQSLPYLLACIKESLRILPPSFGLMHKVVPPQGDTINGTFVPGGTRIGHCVWGVLRNKAIFGADAEIYRPERWLEATADKEVVMTRTADLLFGSGRYACLGKSVAMMELRKALATLFWRYEVSIVDATRPWEAMPCNGMFVQKFMWTRIARRDGKTGEKV